MSEMARDRSNGLKCRDQSNRDPQGTWRRPAWRPLASRGFGASVIALAGLLIACPLVAAPEPASAAPIVDAPIATAELSGTELTVSPDVSFDRASLRVVGPAGYEAIAWSAGEALSLDLLRAGHVSASDGQPGGRPSVLPDGRYGYEVVLYLADGQRHIASGAFRVENGFVSQPGDAPGDGSEDTAAAEPGPRGQDSGLSAKSGSTGEAYVITDTDHDGEANLQIRSNTSAGDLINYWGVRNQSGDLRLSTSGGGDWVDHVTVKPSGRVGIGTTAPGAELDVRGLGGAIHLTDTDACPNPNASWNIEEDFGKLKLGVLDNCPGDLAGGKLWVTGAGEVGIGTSAPGDSLHINRPFPAIRLTDSDPCSSAGQAASWQINEAFGKLRFGVVTKCSGDPAGTKVSITGNGDVGIGTQNPAAKLHVVGSGIIEGDVAFGSSRTIKHEIEPVDGEQILAELRELSVYSWKYNDDPDQADHVGPMAEDVHETFGLGRDGHHLSPADSAGLALAAVRGLDRKTDRELEALRARNRELAAQNEELLRRLARIEERLAGGGASAASPAP